MTPAAPKTKAGVVVPTQHPNALATFKTSAVSGVIAWVALYANNRWGWHIDQKWAVAVGLAALGAANTFRLYIGQRGLVPVLHALWTKYVTGPPVI